MILDQLRSKLVEYHKSKDTLRLGVLKYFLSKVKEKEIEKVIKKIDSLDNDTAGKRIQNFLLVFYIQVLMISYNFY